MTCASERAWPATITGENPPEPREVLAAISMPGSRAAVLTSVSTPLASESCASVNSSEEVKVSCSEWDSGGRFGLDSNAIRRGQTGRKARHRVGFFGGANRLPRAEARDTQDSYIHLPLTMVRSTVTFVSADGSVLNGSCASTTRSASLPGVSDPLICSSKDA